MGTLKLKQVYEGYDLPDDLDLEIIMQDPMPANELEAVQIATNKLAAGLSAVETEMNRLGVEDPEEEIKKILTEKMQYDKAFTELRDRE